MEAKYIHEESVHNLQAPQQIVPLLMNLFHPTSVIDVGCGVGTFLHEFQSHGVKKIHGIDGVWANKDLLSKYIPLECFEEVDLEQPYHSKEKYDLAICLEVVEHLKPETAPVIIESLVNLSDIVVFSAAIPHQGGMNHINEQWPSYWEHLFEKHDYKMLDIIRPTIWNNTNIFVWYKQNMFVVAKKSVVSSLNLNANCLSQFPSISLIHPELYEKKCEQLNVFKAKLDSIYEGSLPFKEYLDLLKNCLRRSISKK